MKPQDHASGDAVVHTPIWTTNKGDAFFSDAQQVRLQELKAHREELTSAEEAELERLVEEAFDATVARAQTFYLQKV